MMIKKDGGLKKVTVSVKIMNLFYKFKTSFTMPCLDFRLYNI